MTGTSPGKFAKRFETNKSLTVNKRKYKKDKSKALAIKTSTNIDYGPECQKEDMGLEEYKAAEEGFLKSLQKTNEEREELEERRLQADSQDWYDERRKLLTASNFGAVCRRLPHTSCQNLVKR